METEDKVLSHCCDDECRSYGCSANDGECWECGEGTSAVWTLPNHGADHLCETCADAILRSHDEAGAREDVTVAYEERACGYNGATEMAWIVRYRGEE